MLLPALQTMVSAWWMIYLFVVYNVDFIQLLDYVPDLWVLPVVTNVATVVVLCSYFFLLTVKVVLPLKYFVFSWASFKLVTFLVVSFVTTSTGYLSRFGMDSYLGFIQTKVYCLLYFVLGQIKTLTFLLELIVETMRPVFSNKLVDSVKSEFSNDYVYVEGARFFFEMNGEFLKIVSNKIKNGYDGVFNGLLGMLFEMKMAYHQQQQQQQQEQQEQQQQQQQQQQDQQDVVTFVEEKVKPIQACFLFKMEMEQVFGNEQRECFLEERRVIEIPVHVVFFFGVFVFVCFLNKKHCFSYR